MDTNDTNSNPMKFRVNTLINEIYNLVNTYIMGMSEDEIKSVKDAYKAMRSFCQTRIPKFKSEIASADFIESDSEFSYWIYESLSEIHRDFTLVIGNLNLAFGISQFANLVDVASRLNNISKEIDIVNVAVKRANANIEPAINQALETIKSRVGQMDNVLLAIETSATDTIYKNAATHYGDKAWNFELAFYLTITLSLVLFSFSLFYPELKSGSDVILYIKYFLTKLVLFATTITLCTIFGRKGAHFRKLQDQAYQTHLELNAFPIHINRLPPEDKNYLIKELALKYFGKEVDQTQNDKIGDLIHDQIKAGTELIRASADMVKVVKPSSGSASTSEPPKVSG